MLIEEAGRPLRQASVLVDSRRRHDGRPAGAAIEIMKRDACGRNQPVANGDADAVHEMIAMGLDDELNPGPCWFRYAMG